MKKILKKLTIASMLFFSATPAALGQELIRGAIDLLLCDTSIIRVISNDSVMICNRREGKHSNFMNITTVMPNPIALYLDSVFVNDFEVLAKKIYFCGYKVEMGKKKAVCGRFELSLFTINPPNMSYYELDTCKEFKKLDVCKYTDMNMHITDTHLIMTGCTETRVDALVDLCMTNTSATCKISFSHDETENYDDVVITDNYVYVSSRREDNGIPIVVFKRYPKPNYLAASIFYTPNVPTLHVSSPIASTPVYLEHVTSDIFAAVYKVWGYYRMAMLEVNGTSGNINCVEILGSDTMPVHPTEIKFYKDSSVYDILARLENVRDEDYYLRPPMRIYHVTQQVLNNQTPMGYGTWYADTYYRLWSIDPLKSSGFFVASGDGGQRPFFFRYKYDEWKLCPKWFGYRFDTGKLMGIEKTEERTYEKIDIKKLELPLRIDIIPMGDTCGIFINHEN